MVDGRWSLAEGQLDARLALSYERSPILIGVFGQMKDRIGEWRHSLNW